MKSKLLALLLCLVMVASMFLFTACGGSKGGDGDSTKAATGEVTDDTARTVALASLFKGIEALKSKAIVATGSIVGTTEEEQEDGSKKNETIDLNLAFTYSNGKFVANASGAAGDENGNFEAFFDGELLAAVSQAEGEDPDYDFENIGRELSRMMQEAEEEADADLNAIADQILALIDFDKVAAKVEPMTAGTLTIKLDGTKYVVTVSSDAAFDAALAILNTVKGSGDKTVAELYDALVGEGSFTKLLTELKKYHGTDKLADLLPKLEEILDDAGLKVDATYDFAAKYVMGPDATGVELKAMLTAQLGDMTVNDAISMAASFSFGRKNSRPVEEYEEYMPSYQAASPEEVGATPEEEDGDTTGEIGMTYEAILAMVEQYSAMKVDELLAQFAGPEAKISDMLETPIAYVTAFKDAFKFTMTLTCSSTLVPEKIAISASIDTTKLPEDMDAGNTKITITLTAEVKDTAAVAPSAALQSKIEEYKANPEEYDYN